MFAACLITNILLVHSNVHSISSQIIVPVIWLFAVLFNLPLLLTDYYSIQHKVCMEHWPEEWMAKSSSMIWLVVTGVIPIFLMIALYARVVHQLWFQDEDDGDSTRQVSTLFHACVMLHVSLAHLPSGPHRRSLCRFPLLDGMLVHRR